LYCFSFFQRAIGATADDYLHHKVRAVNVDKIKRMFSKPDEFGGQFAPYIKRRMTLQWGGLSDGFDFYERKFRKSLELLRFFREIDYPISVSTKGTWWVDDPEYQEVVRDAKNMHWKYSIITTNIQHAKELEMGVPSPYERFEAMEKLNKLGVGATTLRFRPFVLGTSDKCVDEMMQLAQDSGCISVTTEFLTWESRASNTSRTRLDAMSKTLGYDVWQFYLDNSARASGLLRLNYDLKRPYIKQMKESAEAHNLRFFVSDAHHKEDSYHAGCCGLPEDGPLSNVNRGQYAHAIILAKQKGFVQWSDIKDQAFEILSHIPLIAAEGFPSDSVERAKRHYQTMYDYMHDVWNTPKSWQSPARYFGGALVPAHPDENGDIIYLYNKPFIEEGLRVNSVNALAVQLNMIGKPNADRFDEMTKDGGDFGHIAYPVYVFSHGRSDCATTPKLLDGARIQNWSLVVPGEEAEAYSTNYPNDDVLSLPGGAGGHHVGILEARQWILDRARQEGYPYIWMLDDDISGFYRDNGETVSPRALMSGLERFIEDYENVAVMGVSQDGDPAYKLFEPNQWSFRGIYLVNTQTGLDFDPDAPLLEMIEFCLLHLDSKKWTTVLHNQYRVSMKEGLHGGATSLYLSGIYRKLAKRLKEEFPSMVQLEKAPKPFYVKPSESAMELTNTMRSRAVRELMEKEEK
jgi:DNA repair photolyase